MADKPWKAEEKTVSGSCERVLIPKRIWYQKCPACADMANLLL